MNYRKYGKKDWFISEIGYGTWGMGIGPSSWKGSSDEESLGSLSFAIENGLNFIDTAWIYGRGHSEKLIGQILKKYKDKKIYVASKIAPKNGQWPVVAGTSIQEVFPRQHILENVEKSLENLGVDCLDIMYFHVWDDSWHQEEEWKAVVQELLTKNKVKSFGISINTWEPNNVLKTLETGLIEVVQVVYNIFEQQPEDQLIPFCKARNIAVIARVPFDEGSLTGNITLDTKFEEDDWRSSYFVEENLQQCIPRVEQIKKVVPSNMTLPQLALRFILDNPDITAVIPGMRKLKHTKSNLAVSGSEKLKASLFNELRQHRWDRQPTSWSQ